MFLKWNLGKYRKPVRHILFKVTLVASAVIVNACGDGAGNSETISTSVGTTTLGGTILQAQGPNSLGQAPNADGYYPNAAGAYPNEKGIYPDSTGRFPSMLEMGLYPNENGMARNFSSAGAIDPNGLFFKPFGNGRSCASCHRPEDGFSITPANLQARFDASKGEDPIFALNDGANSPLARFTTLDEKQGAFSLLLNKGLIRVGMKIPDDAEFELVTADDPYHYANEKELSLFRRPLPSANLKFASTVMWDGRETLQDVSSRDCIVNRGCFAPMNVNLAHQANSATLGHAQAAQGLSASEQKAIVDFEKTLISAQVYDNNAGFLDVANAKGGASHLQGTEFYFGINDLDSGNLRTQALFTSEVMKNYRAWLSATGTVNPKVDEARKSIARGEVLFNTRSFNPQNLSGIPNDLNLRLNEVTCSSCHNTPQAGSASTPLMVSIFTSHFSQRTPDLPLYTLRNKRTNMQVRTLDPGVAMVTGKWQDIGRFKVPTLRGLAGRAPYFHNGSAETLFDVVFYYDRTFALFLTGQELQDLTAFLSAL